MARSPFDLLPALSPEDRLVLLAFAEPDLGEVRHLDTLADALRRRGLELEPWHLEAVVSGLIGLGLLVNPTYAVGHVLWEMETHDLSAKITPTGWEAVLLLGGRRVQ